MALELSHDGVILRVDGDVLEVFRRGTFSERVLLAWLTVEVQPSIRGSLLLRIASPHGDQPLYEVLRKAKPARGAVLDIIIKTEEEPFYRQFFTQVAALCQRPVMP
jgi:hypothetical protein